MKKKNPQNLLFSLSFHSITCPLQPRPKSTNLVKIDTDVTITGVYVNSSSSQETICKTLKYRTAYSVTEECVVSRPPPTLDPPKSYTPLSALTSMRPPGGVEQCEFKWNNPTVFTGNLHSILLYNRYDFAVWSISASGNVRSTSCDGSNSPISLPSSINSTSSVIPPPADAEHIERILSAAARSPWSDGWVSHFFYICCFYIIFNAITRV